MIVEITILRFRHLAIEAHFHLMMFVAAHSLAILEPYISNFDYPKLCFG